MYKNDAIGQSGNSLRQKQSFKYVTPLDALCGSALVKAASDNQYVNENQNSTGGDANQQQGAGKDAGRRRGASCWCPTQRRGRLSRWPGVCVLYFSPTKKGFGGFFQTCVLVVWFCLFVVYLFDCFFVCIFSCFAFVVFASHTCLERTNRW